MTVSEPYEQRFIDALKPYMKRRMATLALAGVCFQYNGLDQDWWVVRDRDNKQLLDWRNRPLVAAINDMWREFCEAKIVDPTNPATSGIDDLMGYDWAQRNGDTDN